MERFFIEKNATVERDKNCRSRLENSPVSYAEFRLYVGHGSQLIQNLFRRSETGKELSPFFSYRYSLRSKNPSVVIKCPAVMKSMAESVFFRNEKGSLVLRSATLADGNIIKESEASKTVNIASTTNIVFC